MLPGNKSRSFDSHGERMLGAVVGFSFTSSNSSTSFTSCTSAAFTGVYA